MASPEGGCGDPQISGPGSMAGAALPFPLHDVVQKSLEVLPGRLRDVVEGRGSIHHSDPLRLPLGQLQEALTHSLVEFQRLPADAVISAKGGDMPSSSA